VKTGAQIAPRRRGCFKNKIALLQGNSALTTSDCDERRRRGSHRSSGKGFIHRNP
jgi:hypothetical protein